MSVTKLANRYAKSILDEAIHTNVLDGTVENLKSIQEAYNQSSELRDLLKSPLVKGDAKLKVLIEIFGNKVNTLVKNFLALIVDNKREAYLSQIIAEFMEQYNKLKEISELSITTAVQLKQEELVAIATKVKESLNLKNVKVNVNINPAIVGGFIVKLGDRVYDASISNKFRELRKELILN